ncbi:hypothetical protein [Vibrio splendidus]|uniref:hypothetical protein n=1 Tax=Vibrio splendidus TaxID=29497 RepID=UPI00021C3F76|nr:hypothetical protein [Vibrio splendidus]EGU41474.1 hypothetical protein VISP3789_13295 [Vibrio splendidus ATCC 33789]
MYKKTILALSIILASNSSSATPFTDYYNVIEDEYYPSSYKDIEQATTYKDAVIQGMLINSDFLIDFLRSNKNARNIIIISDTINIDSPVVSDISNQNVWILARKITGEHSVNLSASEDSRAMVNVISNEIDTRISINTLNSFNKVNLDNGRHYRYVKQRNQSPTAYNDEKLNINSYLKSSNNNPQFIFDQAFDVGVSIYDQVPNLSLDMLSWYSDILGESQSLMDKNINLAGLYNSIQAIKIFLEMNNNSSDYVPKLKMNVYSDSYQLILDSMSSFQDEYNQFEDHTLDIQARKDAAQLMLGHLQSALEAQQGIIDNQNKKIDSYQKVIEERSEEFHNQESIVEVLEKEFQKGIYEYQAHFVVETMFNCLSIIADLGQAFIGAFTGNVGGVADSADKMASDVKETVFDVKNLKKLAENIGHIKKLSDNITAILKMVKEQNFGADLREQMNDINLAIPELESSALNWTLTQLDISEMLGAAEALPIRGAKAYRASLDRLMTWGSAVSGTQLALIQMSARVVELELAKTAILEDLERVEALIEKIEEDESNMLEVEKYLFRSYNFFKRPLYTTQLNYNAALKYNTFKNSSVVPKLNSTYDEYNKNLVTMNQDLIDYLSSLNSYPQDLNYTFRLENEDIVKSLKESGEFTISINNNKYISFQKSPFEYNISGLDTDSTLKDRERIRVNKIGIQLVGNDLPDGYYRFQVSHSGQFQDTYLGTNYTFNTSPQYRFYSYKSVGSQNSIIEDGTIDEDFGPYIFKPTLMSNWTFKLKDFESHDLSKLQDVKISLSLNSISTPWRSSNLF